MFDEKAYRAQIIDQVVAELKAHGVEYKKLVDEQKRLYEARLEAFNDRVVDRKRYGEDSAETKDKLHKMVADFTAMQTRHQSLEESLNELHKLLKRPGMERGNDIEAIERAAAADYARLRHETRNHKLDPTIAYKASDADLKEAIEARDAWHVFMHSYDRVSLPDSCQRSLSAFSFGSNGFIMPPEMSSRILSCLVDKTDVAGLMANMTIAGPSIKFMVDNVVLDAAGWACETNCFANSPQTNLSGLGELEIRPDPLRYVLCTTRELLEDASVNIQQWMETKVQRAFRAAISQALISGDGNGRPTGILSPQAGIPVCNTGPGSPEGQFTWQDLVLLKWNVPVQYHGAGDAYFMNQNTFGLVLTMSDAAGRPIWSPMPHETGNGMLINGSPVRIVSQFPDVAPGATPVAFGNWQEVYMLIYRRAVTMQHDPYSGGFCSIFRWESRVGGGIICPGAARLLRIQ